MCGLIALLKVTYKKKILLLYSIGLKEIDHNYTTLVECLVAIMHTIFNIMNAYPTFDIYKFSLYFIKQLYSDLNKSKTDTISKSEFAEWMLKSV